MSYTFRDDGPILGPGAQVEIPNGASAAILANLQVMEPVTLTVQAAPTSGTKYALFIAPPKPSVATGALPLGGSFQVVGVEASWGTASTSGTIQVEKCTSGTADGSGTALLTSTIDGSQAAATPLKGALTTNVTSATLLPTDRLNVLFAGTTTNWVNVFVVVYLLRVS